MNYFGTDINMSVGEDIYAALRSGRFPNSAVIEGSTPAKRLSLAKAIAGALVCSAENKPCGVCSHCRKAAEDIHPDIEIYTEDEKGNFNAKTARLIVNSTGVIPNEADAKVYILVTTGPMSEASQNILLKSLEEPPKYAFFITVTPSKADLLSTVLSRSRVFSLGEQEQELSDKDYQKAVEAAVSVAKATMSSNEFDILAAASVFEKNKDLLRNTLPVLEEIFVEAMKGKYIKNGGSAFEGVPSLLAGRFTLSRLESSRKAVRSLADALAGNRNYNLIITRLCSLLRAAE